MHGMIGMLSELIVILPSNREIMKVGEGERVRVRGRMSECE